jgi:hypothetical protein
MDQRLTLATHAVLVAAILIDVVLCVLTWVAPEMWFETLHATTDNAAFYPFLRRCGSHWAAFAIFQFVALIRWQQGLHWLVLVAGMRLSDLFTDLTYLLSSSNVTPSGSISLLVPPVLNLGMALFLMFAFRKALAVIGAGDLSLSDGAAPAAAPA